MSLTTDRNNECLNKIYEEGPLKGQQKCYLILSEEERKKGFVRPVRRTYKHVGIRPKGKIRLLTEEEKIRYKDFNYYVFEEYSNAEGCVTGRYWTKERLDSGCNTETTMGLELAETYARNPGFYGGTFCCHCGKHFPVEEFVWLDGEKVGS